MRRADSGRTSIRAIRSALLTVLGTLALPALAGTQTYRAHIDTDNNAATGCTVATSKGTFPGVELALVTTVTTTTTDARVAGVQLLTCSGGSFDSPRPIDAGGWPVGLGLGDQATSVVETYVPVALLGATRLIRVAVDSTADAGGTDSMVTAPGGGPILIALGGDGSLVPIPTLAGGALALLAGLLGTAGAVLLHRRPQGRTALVAALLLLAAGTTVAAVTLDGQLADWSGQGVRASDPKGNAPVNADLVSFYAQVSGANLFFRIDADVKPDVVVPPTVVTLDPVADQTVPSNTTLSLRLAGRSTDALATLTYGLVSGPSGAAVSPLGVFSFSPSHLQLGQAQVTVTVRDQASRTAQQTFRVTVVDHAHAPVMGALPDDVTSVGASYTRTLTATDPDPGDVLTFSLVSGPAGMTLAGAQLSWRPTAAQLGNWPVEVKVTDRSGLSDSGSFHVGIPLVTAYDDHYEVKVGETLAVAAPGVLGNDVNPVGGSLVATRKSDPDKGTLSLFGADGSFTYQAPAAIGTVFQPVLKPGWKVNEKLGNNGTWDNPRVVDVDGDGKPEVIVDRSLSPTGASSRISVLRGTDGSTLWASNGIYLPPPYEYCSIELPSMPSELAVADVDDSGHPAIIVPARCPGPWATGPGHGTNKLAALDGRTGALKWLSPELSVPDSDGWYAQMTYGTTPAVARLRPGETPSVLFQRTISSWDNSGKYECFYYGANVPQCTVVTAVDGATGALRQRWFAPAPASSPIGWGGREDAANVMVADLTGSGSPNVVAGTAVWDVNGTLISNRLNGGGAQSLALANLDDSGQLAIIGYERESPSRWGWVVARKADGTVLWQAPADDSTPVGDLVVADLHGDGRPKVIVTTAGYLYVYDEHGALVWTHTFHDAMSNPTVEYHNRPAVFDLDGDGVPELIVQTSHGVEFFDGRTGARKAYVRYTDLGYPMPPESSGGSWASFSDRLGPVVVDLDGDGHAEVLFNIVSDIYGIEAMTVALASQANDWQPARPVWNQYGMHDANVKDDGSVPQVEARNFKDPRTNVYANPARIAPKVDPRKREQATFTYQAAAGGYTSSTATVTIDILPPNRPPIFTTTPPSTYKPYYAGDPKIPFVYQAHASDPDPGDTVTYSIVTRGGPERWNFVIDASTGLLTAGTLFGTGDPATWPTEYVTIAATDSQGAVALQNLILKPSPGTAAVPNVVGLQRTVADSTLAGAGFGTGLVTEVQDPAPAGQVLTQVPSAGASVLKGELVALTVSLGPPGAPAPGPPPNLGDLKRIVVTPGSALRVTGETAPFRAIGTNTDGTGSDITAFVTWTSSQASVATVDATGVVHAVAAGTTAVTAAANGLTGSASLTVAARSPGDQTLPTALIAQPASGGTVTGLTQVVGTAADAHFLRYELALQASGDATFTTFATGTSPVTDGVLGTLDPTLLLNGAYTLRLTVWDANGNTATAQVPIVAAGQLKVGSFTLTYSDMTVLLSGFPVQVIRTYDSREKRTGDFGVGWSLGIKALRVSASGVLGTGWTVVQQGTSYALASGNDHFVSVTLPSGKVETFDLQLSPRASFLVPFSTLQASFVPRPGALGTLQSLDSTNVLVVDPQPGPVTLLDDTTLNTFHPDRFLYTQKDGTQFVVRRTKGIESLRDTNGNQITLTPGGISHSSGLGIAFTRDAASRITGITDPTGQTRTYAYSAAGDLASATDRTGNTTTYTYDVSHRLLRIVDPLGRPVARSEYDEEGRLVSVTDAGGHTTTYRHDLQGRLEQIEDALGRVTVLAYDERGNVLSTTDPLGRTTTATYDSRDNQLSATDGRGKTTSMSYDSLDNMTSVTDPLGRTTQFTHDAAGRPLSVKDPRGNTTTSQYDPSGNLVKTTDALGHAVSYGNDTSGNLTSLTTAAGTTTSNSYDGLGRRTRLTDRAGLATTYQYDGNGRLLSEQGSSGFASTRVYDAEGRIVGTGSGGLQRSIAYDASGQPTTVTTAWSQAMPLTFDAAGRLTAMSSPAGVPLLQQTYDAVGNPVTATGPTGSQLSTTYDAAGQATSTQGPGGTTTSRVYDAAGNLVRFTDARGFSTTFGHDDAGQLVLVTDALGRTTSFEYDQGGNNVAQVDPAGNTTRFAYDALDRLVSTTHADGTVDTVSYDADGRVAQRTDTAGGTTTYGYDAAGSLTSVTDPLGHVTRHEYLGGSLRTATTDANGNTTRFAYDAAGRLVSTTYPLGSSDTATYDAWGNMVSTTNGSGETVLGAYDGQGRLLAVTRPGGSAYRYTYTDDNRVASVTGPAGRVAFFYDPATRRLARVTEPDGRFVRYGYDAVGNRTLVAHGDPTGELVTTYTYDALGRLVRVTAPDGGVTVQAYDLAGNLVSVSRPNGVTTTTSHDAVGRTLSITETAAASTVLSREVYTLDARGNRTRVDRLDGSHVEYGYDALGRVVRERRFAPDTTLGLDLVYGYDPAGNLVTSGPAGAPVPFTFDANGQLVAGGGVTYTYDLAGRRTRESWVQGGSTLSRQYTWDATDQLTSFEDETGAKTTYAYDDLGIRRGKGGAPGAVTFLVDPAGTTGFSQLVRESSPAGTSTFVWGGGLLETVEAGAARFHLADGLGSTRLLTGVAGTVTDTFDYEAYGRLLGHTGGSAARHRFAGEEADPESGLTYLRARYLDPRTGTFLTRDPYAGDPRDPLTLHPYAYAAGNPVNRIDPSGRNTLAEVLMSSLQQLRVQGERVLNLRRAINKTNAAVAEVTRVEGGLMAVEAVLEATANPKRVNDWFFGGTIDAALKTTERAFGGPFGDTLTMIRSGLEGAVDVAAFLAMARVGIDMLSSSGKDVDIHFWGVGFITSPGSSAVNAVAQRTPAAHNTCSASSSAIAFAHRPFGNAPGQRPELELCPAFFTLHVTPTRETLARDNSPSMGGVMVHEFAHLSVRARDEGFYGCHNRSFEIPGVGTINGTLRVKAEIPGKALMIADSYRCWAEDAAIGWWASSTKKGSWGAR